MRCAGSSASSFHMGVTRGVLVRVQGASRTTRLAIVLKRFSSSPSPAPASKTCAGLATARAAVMHAARLSDRYAACIDREARTRRVFTLACMTQSEKRKQEYAGFLLARAACETSEASSEQASKQSINHASKAPRPSPRRDKVRYTRGRAFLCEAGNRKQTSLHVSRPHVSNKHQQPSPLPHAQASATTPSRESARKTDTLFFSQ